MNLMIRINQMTFQDEIRELIKKQSQINPNACDICDALISICCDIAFDFLGKEKGRDELFYMIDDYYLEEKENAE